VTAAGVLWVNGVITPAAEATVPALDRGLLYGDGVFETIRAYAAAPFRLRDHLERLADDCRALSIPLGMGSEDLRVAVVETLSHAGAGDTYVRLTVTRGVGGLPSELDQCRQATVMIHARPFAGYPAELYRRGMAAAVSTVRRNETSALCGVKSLNYLDNILAKAQAQQRGFAEALMLNGRGVVAEACAANLFVVRDGRLATPPVVDGCLPGITRGVVMELSQVDETSLLLQDVRQAEEAFLTNSLMEIMPLVSVDSDAVGDGHPGPITRQLCAAYRSLVEQECRGHTSEEGAAAR